MRARAALLLSPKVSGLANPLGVPKDLLFDGPARRALRAIPVAAARRDGPERWFDPPVTAVVPRRPLHEARDAEPAK